MDYERKSQKWLAHISEDAREQTVQEHLQGTAKYCSSFAKEFRAEELGYYTALFHDIGKYSSEFQRRLLANGVKVDHSTAGAWEMMKEAMNKHSSEYITSAFCVAGHHGGLPNGGTRSDIEAGTFYSRIQKAKTGKLPDYSAWEHYREEIPILAQLDGKIGCTRDRMFFTRMLFSCLVDADYLDTEEFMQGKARECEYKETIDELNIKFDEYIKGWFPPKGKLNQLRCDILTSCINQGEKADKGLFTLTVPTGGGKTIASLAFALKHAREKNMKRIIYVIPYTSIIEQTASVFREVLGYNNILEHHSNMSVNDENDSEITKLNLMIAQATENWDMPVVVTTAVQFFESLYSNRTSSCRKLHNIANSVVIFDEAQMMPMPYLRPCIYSISQLVEKYGCSAVLCTATQPSLESLFYEFVPELSFTELCPTHIYVNSVFKRVVFQYRPKSSLAEIANEMNKMEQVLCIVNSRKSAQEIYRSLDGEGVFHLSTLMTANHRKQTLECIRKRLSENKTCKVISTSLIEAGVDVDFPTVFRELSGLDSLLQSAGRCNREGKRKVEDSIVTIFKTEDSIPPLFRMGAALSEKILSHYEDISESKAIKEYFEDYRRHKGRSALDKEGIMDLMDSQRIPFRTIAEKFKLIEENTSTIYIPIGVGAELLNEFRSGNRNRRIIRNLSQYSVSIYDQHQRERIESGIKMIVRTEELSADVMQLDGTEDYELINLNLYSDSVGLSLEADYGKALFI